MPRGNQPGVTDPQAACEVMQAVLEHLSIAAALLDGRDLRVRWHNPLYASFFPAPFADADLRGLTLAEYCPQAREPNALEVYRRAAAGETVVLPDWVFRRDHPDATCWSRKLVPLPRADGTGYDCLILLTDVTQSVRLRERLEASGEQAAGTAAALATIIETIGDGVVVYNTDGTIARSNAAVRRIVQYTETEALLPLAQRMALADPRDAAGRPLSREQYTLSRALHGETVSSRETRLFAGTAREVVALYSGAPLRGPQGEVVGAVVTITDITAMRRTEEALQESRERYGHLFRAMDDAIAVMEAVSDANGTVVDMRLLEVNPAFEALVCFSREDLLGHLKSETIGRCEDCLQVYRAVLASGEALHRELYADRAGRWYEVCVLPCGVPHRVAAVYSDITARKQAELEKEAALRAEAEVRSKYQALIETTSDFIWETDAEGRYTYCSPQVQELWGLHPEQMLGRTPVDLMPEQWRRGGVEDGFAALLKDPYPVTRWESPFHDASGNLVYGESSGVPFYDDAGVFRGLRGITRDITLRKHAEAELQRHREHLEDLVRRRTAALEETQQRLRALASELVRAEQAERQRVAGLLHDEVAQPLGALKLQLAMLSAAGAVTAEDLQPLVATADEATKRAREIMSELSPPVLQRFGLAEAVRWWGGTVEQRYALPVEVHAPAEPLDLGAVLETALFQATKELLHNVVKHAAATRAVVSFARTDGELSVTVSDDGVGFAPEAVETTVCGGFGLFSIRERLAYLGGSAAVQSTPGEGTTVTLRLPLDPGNGSEEEGRRG